MSYQVLALDLDGTLTTSKKEITPATRAALIEIQEKGKIVVLASGRPDNGVLPLADELELSRLGGYMLTYNGAKITDCRTGTLLYNRTLPLELTRPIYELVLPYQDRGVGITSYAVDHIIAGIQYNQYLQKESDINHLPIVQVEDFPASITTPVNKLLITGDPPVLEELKEKLTSIYNYALNIYFSEPFFLEIMPQNVDKADSLQKLMYYLGLTADELICCGDGFNDLTMIEYAGLGVAMENAQSLLLEKADFVTKSNDNEGILYVVDRFMRGKG